MNSGGIRPLTPEEQEERRRAIAEIQAPHAGARPRRPPPARAASAMAAGGGGAAAATLELERPATRRRRIDPANPETWGKVGRNAPCPCGSGKKFKHCHGRMS